MTTEKIIIGSFEFESDTLQSELANVRSNLDNVSKALADARKESKDYSKDIVDLARSLAGLEQAGKANSDEYKEGTKRLKAMQVEQDKINDAVIEFEKSQRALRQEYSDGIKVLQAHAKAQDINLENYQTEGKSIRELRRESQALTTLRNELATVTGEETEEIKMLNALIEQNTMAQKDNVNANQKRFYQIGLYKEELAGSFGEIKSAIDALKQGNFDAFAAGVRGGFAGMTNAAKTFFITLMSNPLTAIIAVLGSLAVATGAVVKEFWDYNEAIRPAIRLTEQITKLQGEAADSARNQANAYTETFGGEFQDNLKAARELVEDFGISYDEAFDLMTRGTIKGANVNGEFQDSIKEYGVLFQQAGYSAEEFVNIINAGADLGVYKDKLPDAVKEAQISISEQTKATKTALVDAFGQSFTDDLLDRVNRGQTNVKDALFEISEEAEKTALTQQQLATITADVFRGAGEDAGGAVKIFEAFNYAADNSSRALTELEEHTYSLAKANEELAIAKDNALKSDTILAFQGQFERSWIEIKTGWYNFIADLLSGLDSIEKGVAGSSAYVRGVFLDIPKTASAAFNQIWQSFKNLISNMMAGGSVLKNLISGNLDQATDDFKKVVGSFGNFANDLKEINSNTLKALGAAGSAEQKKILDEMEARTAAAVERSKKKAEEANKITGARPKENLDIKSSTKAVKDASKELEKAQREAIQAIKEMNAALAEQADIASSYAQHELSKWIATNAAKITSEKRLSDDLIALEDERLAILMQKQSDALEIEKVAKELKLQQEIDLLNSKGTLNANELLQLQNLNDQKLLIGLEYAEKERLQEEAIQKEKDRIAKAKLEQDAEDEKVRRAIAFQEELLMLEEENASKFEFERSMADDRYSIALAALDDQLHKEQISIENYQAKIRNLTKEHEQTLTQIKQIEEEARLSLAQQTFGDVANLLGRQTAVGKAAGIASATINTWQGVSEVWRAPTILPEPFGTIQKVASTGTVLGSGLKAVDRIVNTKIPGYAFGGRIGTSAGIPITRDNGDNVLITARTGEAILNEDQQRRIGYNNLALAGVPGFAVGGRVPASNNILHQQNIMHQNNLELGEIVHDAVVKGAQQGTYMGSSKGIKDLSTNQQISKGANHE